MAGEREREREEHGYPGEETAAQLGGAIGELALRCKGRLGQVFSFRSGSPKPLRQPIGPFPWLLLGNILHFFLLWSSGKSPLNC